MEDFDHLEIPPFLRRTKEGDEAAKKNPRPVVIAPVPEKTFNGYASQEAFDQATAKKKVATKNRIGKMLKVKSDRDNIAEGKKWNVKTGRWE